MAKVALFVCLTLAVISLSGSQAASEKDENRTVRQATDELYYDPYDLESIIADSPVYQPSPRIADFASEGRSYYRNPFRYPFYKAGFGYEESQPQARLNGLGVAAINNILFNNRFNNNRPRPLASLNNYIPVQWNPNFPNLATTFDSCTAPTGESGICSPGSICSVFGGRPSGSCGLAGVCCVNAVSTCGSTVTLNNTYWQSPTTPITGAGTCSVSVRLDQTLKEQKKPICQIRLSFISFTTAGPNSQTVCNVDSFQVGGALNTVPTICGDNANQHMYINVPNSLVTPSDVRLLFSFGAAGTVTRSWNIRISLLPCGADYLAPPNCLQYFTSASGTIRSFNYGDSTTLTRQLANQDYNVCFRTELVNNQRASTLCISPCNGVPLTSAFRLSEGPAAGQAQVGGGTAATSCINDFIIFTGGVRRGGATPQQDRFCGEAFNAESAGTATDTVCTSVRNFRLYYRTNDVEVANELVAARPPSLGYCLDFTQNA